MMTRDIAWERNRRRPRRLMVRRRRVKHTRAERFTSSRDTADKQPTEVAAFDGFVARGLTRDEYRRSLVTSVTNSASGLAVEGLAYSYDALNRPTNRNDDAFLYNDRNEVVVADISGREVGFSYDGAGSLNGMTSAQDCYYMELNSCSQYTSVGHALAYNDPEEYYPIAYDLDGNMTLFRDWSYTYDAANRLKTVSMNGVLALTNFYDAKSRRVKKVTPEATTTFFYDDWNLIEERVAYTNGTSSTIRYYWGKDLFGTLQGAGGIGGLLYLTVSNSSTPNSSTQQLYMRNPSALAKCSIAVVPLASGFPATGSLR